LGPTAGPACTTDSAAEPGSELPLCSRYCTDPVNRASVTSDPSAARNRETIALGGGGGLITCALVLAGAGALLVAVLCLAVGVDEAVGVADTHAVTANTAMIR